MFKLNYYLFNFIKSLSEKKCNKCDSSIVSTDTSTVNTETYSEHSEHQEFSEPRELIEPPELSLQERSNSIDEKKIKCILCNNKVMSQEQHTCNSREKNINIKFSLK